MTTTPLRAVIYARISVTKEESVSVDRQLESCRRYAEARGWEIAGEFVDDGVSASLNRPEDRQGWGAVLRAEGYQAVIIWKVDRLARKVLDFLNADRALQEKGAGLVAVEDPVDLTTPQGRAFATILAVFGEMEAEAIRARVKAARKHLIKEGRWAGGGVPYGYRPTEHPGGVGKWLEKDPERIDYLVELVDKFRSGATVAAVATHMTESGSPLPYSSAAKRKHADRQWFRQSVECLLRNPILAGMIRSNPGRAKSAQAPDPFQVRRDTDGEPIIYPELAIMTVAEFAEIQERLDARSTPQAKPFSERQRTSRFLSKVAKCDDCDVYMCRGTNQGRPTIYCPKCRMNLSRNAFDPWLIGQLLDRVGNIRMGTATIREHWPLLSEDDHRRVLLDHLASLRVRRGVVGRYFDEDRILIRWKADEMLEPAS